MRILAAVAITAAVVMSAVALTLTLTRPTSVQIQEQPRGGFWSPYDQP